MVLLQSLPSRDNALEITQCWRQTLDERSTSEVLQKGTIDAALDVATAHRDKGQEQGKDEEHNANTEPTSTTLDAFISFPSDNDKENPDEDDSLELTPCAVWVDGRLRQRREEFQDLVQVWTFQDFAGLAEFMELHKQGIEQRQASTLQVVHERFQTIVQTIIDKHGLYKSGLSSEEEQQSSSSTTDVALYASPNVRWKRGGYATFLHSDAVYSSASTTTTTKSACSTRAMINIWLSLNSLPTPGNYPLCFVKCPLAHTRRVDTKLYGQAKYMEHNNSTTATTTTMVFDANMCWGKFYCFVSGQTDAVQEVLLHGAVRLDAADKQKDLATVVNLKGHCRNGNRNTGSTEPRKSLEMRYLV
eukprot:scaffold25842_cov198-Amphora_coffeaeformis.AAC.36